MSQGHFAAVLLAVLGLACASPVEVRIDPSADFSLYRTWDWLPGSGLVIHAPERETDFADFRVAQLIAGRLTERGLERSTTRPDLRIGVVLTVRLSLRVTHYTGAMRSLTSHHETVYEVSAQESRVDEVKRLRLEVYVVEQGGGRLVWEARTTEEVVGNARAALDAAAAQLLAEFPRPRSPARRPRSTPPRPDPRST